MTQPYGFDYGFDLVFEDDFPGSALDTGKWAPETADNASSNASFNPGNITVADSLCSIERRSEVSGSHNYTSGRMKSVDLYCDYAYAEARMKVGGARGWNVAFWLSFDPVDRGTWWVPATYIVEFDVIEYTTNGGLPTSYNTQAWDNTTTVITGANKTITPLTESNFYDEFHVFALWHRPGELLFLVDGQPQQAAPYSIGSGHHFVLNCTTAAPLAYTIEAGDLPMTTDIDWVRVYNVRRGGPRIML